MGYPVKRTRGVSMKKYLVLFLFPTFLYSQQRYLVTPNDEFIPMRGGESFANAVHRAKEESSKQSACGTKFIFGYVSSHLYESFGAKHKDVMAQWYVAKASGTIDSIFIEDPGPVGNYDSSVSIRIFRSNIQPGIGPGFGPYRAPCAPWGYYVCTNDLDRGISPFKDEATDSTWNSTAMEDSGSFDPLGELIWGHGGVTVKMIDYLWTNWLTVSTTEFGESLRVKAGDAFFITMKVRSLNAHPTGLENFTYFGGEQFHVSPGVDELYPSRFW